MPPGRWIVRNAVRRGLLGGSRPWMVAGAVVGGTRMLRRMARKQATVVYSEELQPGETLVIRHEGPTEP